MAAHAAIVEPLGTLKIVTCSMMKIANDIRWIGSVPRCDICELFIPYNENDSSIMTGKVNQTQSEAMTMVVAPILITDVAG